MSFRILFAAVALTVTLVSPVPVRSSEAKPWLPVEIGIVAAAGKHDAAAEMWQSSAQEQGLPARVVSIDDVWSDWRNERHRFAALVLPDELAQTVSPSFVAGLRRFVEGGGRLLVVFDAALLDPKGEYALNRSVLSDLVGVNYAIYGRMGDDMFRTGPVFASAASAEKLGIPPGLAIEDPKAAARAPFDLRLRTYGYPELTYPSLATQGHYDGEPLLVGFDGQIVAGIRSVAKGRVIFANLPLGDLKLNGTDGWPLHRFLRLLARESRLPVLAMTPGGIGGMVMNIHVDSSPLLDTPRTKHLAALRSCVGAFATHRPSIRVGQPFIAWASGRLCATRHCVGECPRST